MQAAEQTTQVTWLLDIQPLYDTIIDIQLQENCELSTVKLRYYDKGLYIPLSTTLKFSAYQLIPNKITLFSENNTYLQRHKFFSISSCNHNRV
jgi:hypothetical protein